MFLPLDRGIDWRHPPLATFALAGLCVLAYLLFQLDDRQEQLKAFNYYYDSGLAAIELPAYRDWLKAQGRREELVQRYGDAIDDRRSPWYRAQLQDQAFQDALEAGEIIGRDHEAYSEWRRKRDEYTQLLAERTVAQWGLKPDRLAGPNLITHQFLHGGPMHLIGNLLFLVAVGILVESIAGVAITVVVYVLGGIGAGLAFVVLNPATSTPLVGASGSISALMGAMAVGYGLNRVRVFIHLGVYLDYRRVPALVLLIPWFGYEWLKLQWYGEASSVAYTAHMGGIAAGALLMVPVRLFDQQMGERARASEEGTEPVDEILDRAARARSRMDVDEAIVDYQRVLALAPDDQRALKGVYDCRRLQPASEAYHQVAHSILQLTGARASGLVREVYDDYRQLARPKPRLTATTLQCLAARFIKERDFDEAERILRVMGQRPDAFPELKQRIGELIRLLREAGEEQRAARWAATAKRLD